MKLKEGSTVCCLGDSLTHMGSWIYDINGYLAEKGSKTRFYNCGIGGGMASYAMYYLEDEVLRLDPDYVMVMFGANDIGQYLYDKKQMDSSRTEEKRQEEISELRKKYEESIKIICQMLIQREVKVILMTPMLFDEYESHSEREIMCGASDELVRYGEIVKKTAAEMNVEVIHLCEEFKCVEPLIEKDAVKLFQEDRVHPSEAGYSVMASIILKYFEYDINVPKSEEEIKNLPFHKTIKNDERFGTEQRLRSISFLERLRYCYAHKKRYYLSWEEIAEDLIKCCFENDFAESESIESYKQQARDYVIDRPRKNELERLLIKQTNDM